MWIYQKRILDIGDTKYAKAIGEVAPIVVGLVQTIDDELEKKIQCQVIKMRNAPKLLKIIYLHPNLDLMRINSVETIGKGSLRAIEDDVGDRKITSSTISTGRRKL